MIISTYLFTLKNIKLVNWRKSGWRVSISTRRMSKSKEWYAQLLRGQTWLKYHVIASWFYNGIELRISKWNEVCPVVTSIFFQLLPTVQRKRKSLFSLLPTRLITGKTVFVLLCINLLMKGPLKMKENWLFIQIDQVNSRTSSWWKASVPTFTAPKPPSFLKYFTTSRV